MTRDDGMRIVRNSRDTENLMMSPREFGGMNSSMSKVVVRITGDKNTYANAFPAVITYRDLTVSDPTSTGAWIDLEEVMVEEVNNEVLLETKRYKGYVWGLKNWVDAEDADQMSMYVEVSKGGTSDSPPPAPCGGCGWFAGATEYDCWTMTVVGAGGNMDSLDESQILSLSWVADVSYPDGGYWESATDFTICDCIGKVRLWRDEDRKPQFELVGCGYGLSLSCCDTPTQTLNFSGGNSGNTVLCCTRQIEGGSKENLFTVAIRWTRCPPIPNPDYTTPGWYCVAVTDCSGSRQCCNLTSDPGITVILCSGPHADEATCTALCTPPDTIHVVCGGIDTQVPVVLFATFDDGTTTTLIYDAGPAQWTSPDFTYRGYSIYIHVAVGVCDEETGILTWGFGVGSHSDTCAEGTTSSDTTYDPFSVLFTGVQPLIACGVPDSITTTVFISE